MLIQNLKILQNTDKFDAIKTKVYMSKISIKQNQKRKILVKAVTKGSFSLYAENFKDLQEKKAT